jgi:hypothetical protein
VEERIYRGHSSCRETSPPLKNHHPSVGGRFYALALPLRRVWQETTCSVQDCLLGFRHNPLRLDPAHADGQLLWRDAGDFDILDALALGVLADVAHPEIAAQLFPFRTDGRLAVEHHQAEVGVVEIDLPAATLDDLVVAFVACDFQAVAVRPAFRLWSWVPFSKKRTDLSSNGQVVED